MDMFFNVPLWFLAATLSPFSNIYTLIAFIGFLLFGIGWALANKRPHKGLWLSVVSVVLSQGIVVFAGFRRGDFPDLSGDIGLIILLGFAIPQLVCLGFLIYLSRGSRLAAVSLSGFCAVYALHSYFFACMALTDTWI